MSNYIDIVFDGPPGPTPGRFVEVEDADGKSIRVGEWVQRDDFYWVLRLPDPDEIARLRQWVEDLQSGMYVNCVYCGHRYGPDDTTPVSMADALKEHVEKCPEHPMSHLRSQLEAAREQLQRIIDNKTATSELHESWEQCAINMGAIAKQALRQLETDGGGE